MALNRWTRAALAVISGAALAAAFPKLDFNLLAWIAFIPLFYGIEGEPLGDVFRYSWLQGFACFVGSLYWIVITLHTFAGLNMVIAVLPMLLLAGVMALYTAVAIWTGEFVSRRLNLPATLTMPIRTTRC